MMRLLPLQPSVFVNSPGMGFEAFYCMPGIQGAHEKGGVEGEVGHFRRNLVPVPEVATLAKLSERIAVIDRAEDDLRPEHRVRTIGQDFGVEQPRWRRYLSIRSRLAGS